MFDHVTIRVSDRAASERFYDAVLRAIGVERTHSDVYYAEWNDHKNKILRLSAFLVPVKETTFAQLTPMEADGELQAKHLIVKVQLDGDKLTLTNLKEDFFGDVTTDAALKKKIEENISNPAMYEDIGTGARTNCAPANLAS